MLKQTFLDLENYRIIDNLIMIIDNYRKEKLSIIIDNLSIIDNKPYLWRALTVHKTNKHFYIVRFLLISKP